MARSAPGSPRPSAARLSEIRVIQPTYNYRCAAGDGCCEPEDAGLSHFYGYDERYYPRPPWTWPRGIEWLHQGGSISLALLARGFSPEEAAGIMGLKFLRVLATIWAS